MKEVMTIGEYLEAAKNFEHSKEYYEMLKEASEANLMAIYLDGYDYMAECVDYDIPIHESVVAMFDDTIFTEASAKVGDAVANGAAGVDEVRSGFMKKIWNGVITIFKAIAWPFTAIHKVLDRSLKDITESEYQFEVLNINEIEDESVLQKIGSDINDTLNEFTKGASAAVSKIINKENFSKLGRMASGAVTKGAKGVSAVGSKGLEGLNKLKKYLGKEAHDMLTSLAGFMKNPILVLSPKSAGIKNNLNKINALYSKLLKGNFDSAALANLYKETERLKMDIDNVVEAGQNTVINLDEIQSYKDNIDNLIKANKEIIVKLTDKIKNGDPKEAAVPSTATDTAKLLSTLTSIQKTVTEGAAETSKNVNDLINARHVIKKMNGKMNDKIASVTKGKFATAKK